VRAGIRQARSADVEAVQGLLAPLERAGVLVKRSRQELRDLIYNFYVLERETKVGEGGASRPPATRSPGKRLAIACHMPRARAGGDTLLVGGAPAVVLHCWGVVVLKHSPVQSTCARHRLSHAACTLSHAACTGGGGGGGARVHAYHQAAVHVYHQAAGG
jgi:hypothetical protein